MAPNPLETLWKGFDALQKSGDDVGDDSPIEPPTCWQVLQASLVIHKYIDTMNDPVACKLEAVLASFNCNLHLDAAQSTRATKIPDWFRREDD
jgi:hypothetical protein